MCSGGGPFITMETGWFKNYCCKNCGKKFKVIGKNPICPSCQSEDPEEIVD